MDTAVDEAFRAVRRAEFLPDEVRAQADADVPLPIGFGQTNSQPATVAMMLEWLEVEPGNHLLDVGAGSGWTSALLAYLAGPKGSVVAVEVVPELVVFGRENCARAGVRSVEFHTAGKVYGYPAKAPYDRILVSAAARKVPDGLVGQLALDGRMAIPVRHDVLVLYKDLTGGVSTDIHPGFVFVPLVPADYNK